MVPEGGELVSWQPMTSDTVLLSMRDSPRLLPPHAPVDAWINDTEAAMLLQSNARLLHNKTEQQTVALEGQGEDRKTAASLPGP